VWGQLQQKVIDLLDGQNLIDQVAASAAQAARSWSTGRPVP
jgi:hypothetical protein